MRYNVLGTLMSWYEIVKFHVIANKDTFSL